jgi:hypothetical protein
MPMTFVVTSGADDGTGQPGTLSAAIDAVDSDSSDSASNPDTITFDVGTGGAQTITVTGALPRISAPAIIDGTTQPGTFEHAAVNPARCNFRAPGPARRRPGRRRTRPWARADRDEFRRVDAAGDDPGRAPSSAVRPATGTETPGLA